MYVKKIIAVMFILTTILTFASVSNAGGLAASQGRIIYLMQRQNDIEFKLQTINHRRTVLAEQSAQVARDNINSLYNVNDTSNYNSQIAQLQAMDSQLELRQKDLEVQYKVVQAEINALQKIIDRNIKSSFKIFY